MHNFISRFMKTRGPFFYQWTRNSSRPTRKSSRTRWTYRPSRKDFMTQRKNINPLSSSNDLRFSSISQIQSKRRLCRRRSTHLRQLWSLQRRWLTSGQSRAWNEKVFWATMGRTDWKTLMILSETINLIIFKYCIQNPWMKINNNLMFKIT